MSKVLLLAVIFTSISFSTLFSEGYEMSYNRGKKYSPKNEFDYQANRRTKHLSYLLQQDKKDNGSRTLNCLENNKNSTFKTAPNCSDCIFCTPLYYVAVIHSNIDIANTLLTKGARTSNEFETELLLRNFIKHDKKFNNPALQEMLRANKNLINKKDCFNFFENFIDQAQKYNNNAAKKILENTLQWEKPAPRFTDKKIKGCIYKYIKMKFLNMLSN